MATLFMTGLAFSFYILFTSEVQGIPNRFYVILGVSSVLGAAALVMLLTERNEIVVYREQKKADTQNGKTEHDETKTTISLEAVKAALKSARKPEEAMQNGLTAICKQVEAGQGAYYHVESTNEKKYALLKAGYALTVPEGHTLRYEAGDGLIGQTAITGQTLYLDEVPEGYIKIISGLGSSSPRYILIAAAKKENQVVGVVEIASFTPITADQRKFVEESTRLIAEKLAGK